MLTYKFVIDARDKCPECDGSGEYRMKCNICPNEMLSGRCKINKTQCVGDCPTCNGTGHAKVVWTEPIGFKIPKNYKFKRYQKLIEKDFAVFEYCLPSNDNQVCAVFPYRTRSSTNSHL